MRKHVEHPGIREGYDRWSSTYDATQNPLVAIDRRHSFAALDPRPGERVLDAGCGTGAYLRKLHAARATAVGLDLSFGMLRIARRLAPSAGLLQADLNSAFPIRAGVFDAVICTLVSEHLTNLHSFFGEVYAALCRGGRFVFSTFHPELARSGVEANFERDGVEYRLGAQQHTMDDYLNHISDAGFQVLWRQEYTADAELVCEVPWAKKYLGRPILALIQSARVV